MNILIIDDSVDYSLLLRNRIEAAYYDASVEEHNPVNFYFNIESIVVENYDLIFLDYDFGSDEVNGLHYLKHISRRADPPPVIFLTAADDVSIASQALKLGASDFLRKDETDSTIIADKITSITKFNNVKRNLERENEQTFPEIKKEDTPPPATESSDQTHHDLLFSSGNEDQGTESEIFVPGYEILREIGRGGMSTVLLANRLEDNEEVVLKVLFTEGHEDPLALKRFMQEYTLISALNHKHVIRIFERAFASNFAYIAMEYFPGGDLSGRIKSGLTSQQSCNYLKQMATGLEEVHKIDVIHRDLKPGNILFREDESLTITDFGAAKDINGDMEDITVNNMIVGTPYYMSPEQATGIRIDKRSDIYSLGVMFYQMLTGKRPFNANSLSQLIYAHLHEPTPTLPESLSSYQPLINGMMEKEPDERFQDASDIIIALDWL